MDELPGARAVNDSAGVFNVPVPASGATFVGGGISGNALSLDGSTNAYISLGPNVIDTSAAFTVSVWVRLANGDLRGMAPWSKYVSFGSLNNGANAFIGTYAIAINGVTNSVSNPGRATFFVGGVGALASAGPINDGQWHNLVGVYDGPGMTQRFYVDGILAGTRSNLGNTPSPANFLIGGSTTSSGVPRGEFAGLIDEVQIYRRALSGNEVEFLFGNPSIAADVTSAPGNLDYNFDPSAGFANVGVKPVTISRIAPLPNSRLLIGGSFASYRGVSTPNFARLNPDGTVDTTFFHGFGASAEVIDFAVQSDNRIVLVGAFDAYHEIFLPRIARITADGLPDPSFRPGNGADNNVHSVAIQNNGSLFIGGNFTSYDATNRPGIARLLANGKLDLTFDPGAGFSGYVNDVVALANGQILAGGSFTNFNGVARNGLVRINGDGSLDTSFTAPFESTAEVKEVVVQSDGRIVAVGSFALAGSNGRRNAVRLNTDGSLDGTFGSSSLNSGPNAVVNAIETCADGTFIVGGDFTSYDGVARTRLAKLTIGGLLDNQAFFNTQQQSFTNTVNLTNTFTIFQTNFLPSTNLIFGYASNLVFTPVSTNTAPPFTQTNLISTTNIVGSVDISTSPNTNATYFGLGGGANAEVHEIVLTSAQVPYIGGAFTNVYGIARRGLAKLNPCTAAAGSGFRITGTLINATTGGAIPGATVTTVNEIATSSPAGTFNLLNAVAGPNQVIVSANGFFTQTNTVNVTNSVTPVSFVLSPGITDTNTLRLVLTWGALPGDLDSYLTTPPINGQPGQKVYFVNRGSLTSVPFVALDVDDVDGFGPETLTLTNVFPGIYNFYINIFAGGAFAGAGFSNSLAKVEIFNASGLIGTINAPTTSTVGDYWHVLQLNGTNRSFAVINSISNAVPTINTNVVYNQSVGNVGSSSVGLPGPPRIDVQPADTYALAGNPGSISVGASGTAPLAFQWYRNGAALSARTSATLAFPSLTTADSGEYFVVVTNVLGVVTSRVARVTALSTTAPFVFLQPADLVVDVGGTATFESIGGGSRPLFYQWRHDGAVVPNVGGPLLTITNVQVADTGIYQLTLANGFGTVFSKDVNLLVATPPVITNFTVTPSSRVTAGQTVTFEVAASGKGPFEYIWRFNGAVLPTELASSLTIPQSHFTNGGDYLVVVTNSLGAATNGPITLTVDSPPIITVEPQNQFQTISRTVDLRVTAIGSAPLSYQWRKDGMALSGATATQLSITNIAAADVGLYSVVVANSLGAITSRLARVDVVLEQALLPWVQRLGGSSADIGNAVGLDGAGNSYVAGRFAGTAQFGTNSLTSAGLDDIFISKLDPAGNVVWARRIGGGGFDVANDIAADTNGNLFVTGSFEGTVDFGGTVATNTNSASYRDLFVARFDGNGNLVWVRTEGDPFIDDAGHSIAIDTSLNVYVAGSSTIGSFGGTALTNDGRILLARYDANGNRGWARKAGAGTFGSLDRGTGVAVDQAGNVLLSATIQSATATSGGVVLTNRGFADGLAVKFDAAGAQQWVRQFGSLGADGASGIAAAGTNVIVVGQFSGTNDFGGVTLASDGGSLSDGFVVNLDASGALVWVQKLGGSGSDSVQDVAVDGRGAIYVTGFFQGVARFGDKTSISIAATTDIFAARLRPDGTFEFVQQAGGDNVAGESGRGIAADAAGNGVFTGNFQGTLVAGGNSRVSSGGDDVFVSRLVSPPQLRVEISGNQLIFSWPNFWSGFALEANGVGLSGTNWLNTAAVPADIGGRFFITNTISTNAQFYRLSR
jgi:uncharacterized delta-60 repeat protein